MEHLLLEYIIPINLVLSFRLKQCHHMLSVIDGRTLMSKVKGVGLLNNRIGLLSYKGILWGKHV